MQLFPLEIIEGWHSAVNAGDYEHLCALTSRDIELVDPRGSSRGQDVLRQWLGQAAFTAEPLRWFCASSGRVVVEQRDATEERIVASAFRVVNGRVVRYQRFDALGDALASCALTDDDEVLHGT